MYCQNCGAANDEDAKFCANCGTTLGPVVPLSEAPSIPNPPAPVYQTENPQIPQYQAPPYQGNYQQPGPTGGNSMAKNIGIGCLIAIAIVFFVGLSCMKACFGLHRASRIIRHV